MMITIKKLISISTIGLLIITAGCRNQQSSVNSATEEDKPSVHSEITESGSVFYLIPSPGEILERFQSKDFQFNPDLLNSPENKSKYITTRAKSLNMGIYIADMAYCANFERTSEAIDYLEAIKSLSYEVNISSSVFESLIQRARNVLGQRDSIIAISNEVFYEMIEFLEDGGKMNTISLISSGAFIESLFLAVESVDKFTESSEIIKQLDELRYPLENILAQAQQSDNDPNVKIIQVFLSEVNDIFTNLSAEKSETIVKRNESGEITLLGGSTYVFNEENFAALKIKVREIRSNIISN